MRLIFEVDRPNRLAACEATTRRTCAEMARVRDGDMVHIENYSRSLFHLRINSGKYCNKVSASHMSSIARICLLLSVISVDCHVFARYGGPSLEAHIMISPTIIRAAQRGQLLATVTSYCDNGNYPLTFQTYITYESGKTEMLSSDIYQSQVEALDAFQRWTV